MTEGNSISKSHSADRRRRLSECYKRGVHLAKSEMNYDYAHAMFAECVLNDPGNSQFVEAMIQNLRAKTPNARKWHLSNRANRTFTKRVRGKDWSEVIRV